MCLFLFQEKLVDPETYKRITRKLLNHKVTSHSVQQLSQFLSDPHKSHFSNALHVLKYLKDTVNVEEIMLYNS